MSYHLLYHPDIKGEDLPYIPTNVRKRIKRATEERLSTEPEKYGEPLRRSLQGYRKLRVGDYRVIYKVRGENVVVLKIGHRKEVYERLFSRMD